MPFKAVSQSASRLETVDLGGLGSFQVKVRRPTWDEKCADEGFAVASYLGEHPAARAEQVEHRIRCAVVGWIDLLDKDDQPLPFSWNALTQLCEHYHGVFRQFDLIAARAFRSLGEDAEKNLSSPRNDSSVDPSTATL